MHYNKNKVNQSPLKKWLLYIRSSVLMLLNHMADERIFFRKVGMNIVWTNKNSNKIQLVFPWLFLLNRAFNLSEINYINVCVSYNGLVSSIKSIIVCQRSFSSRQTFRRLWKVGIRHLALPSRRHPLLFGPCRREDRKFFGIFKNAVIRYFEMFLSHITMLDILL